MGPWDFDYSGGWMNAKRTFRNFARLAARVFGNLGAEMRTPILERFFAPAAAEERRWLRGLYMDSRGSGTIPTAFSDGRGVCRKG